MARFYSNEDIPLQVVVELRRLGHDVMMSFDAGNANSAVLDDEVLAFAAAENRILITTIAVTFSASINAALANMPVSSLVQSTPIFVGRPF